MTHKENTEKLKSRFQFLVTIALFFPVILDSLLNKDSAKDSSIIFYWGFQVAILILGYILIECTKKWSNETIYKLANFSLFVNLGSFIVVFYIFADMQKTGSIPYFYKYVFSTAFPAILIIPSFLVLLLATNLIILSVKKN